MDLRTIAAIQKRTDEKWEEKATKGTAPSRSRLTMMCGGW